MQFLRRLYHKSRHTCYTDTSKLQYRIKDVKNVYLVDDNVLDPCKISPKVIIIGAGMAGLSAAAKLNEAGITDITLLEATERPGGRIQSCWFGNTVIDVGAQWIHGCSIINNTSSLAAREGLLNKNLYKYVNGLDPAVMYLSSDSKIINKSLALKAYMTYKDIEKKAYGLYKENEICINTNRSLMCYLEEEIEKKLKDIPLSQRAYASQIMYGQTTCLKNRWGEELDKISANLLGSFKAIPGDTVAVPNGFIGVLAPILKDIPRERIHYKKVVNNIRWAKVCNDDGTPAARSRVTCCDGSSYCADYIIITVSLGVLKEIGEKIFQPKLPEEKLEAIQKLGYGNCCKIFLEYSKPFWAWKEGTINLLWNDKEMKQKDQWVTGVSMIEEVPDSRQTLKVSVAGDQASIVETLPDRAVAGDITDLLRKFTGDTSLPYPQSVLITRWKANKHFAGTNSYMSVDSNVSHQCELAATIPLSTQMPCPSMPPHMAPILFFAGEATCKDYYSTVHGARLSGLSAAQQVIDLTKLYQGPPPQPGEKAKVDPSME